MCLVLSRCPINVCWGTKGVHSQQRHCIHRWSPRAMLFAVMITCWGWEVGKDQTLQVLPLHCISKPGKKGQHLGKAVLCFIQPTQCLHFSSLLLSWVHVSSVNKNVCPYSIQESLTELLIHNSITKVLSYFPGHCQKGKWHSTNRSKWSLEWMCVDMSLAMSRTWNWHSLPPGEAQGDGKAFLGSEYKCWLCAENVHHRSPP